MLYYVGGIKGFDSEEYKALSDYVHNGKCTYKGNEHVSFAYAFLHDPYHS